MQEIEALIKDGAVSQALDAAQDLARKHPAKAEYRRVLFELLCVMGQWDRAKTQLKVMGELGGDEKIVRVFGELLRCEILRAEVFEGKKTPLVMGEPEEWLGWLVKSNEFAATGELAAAADLRAKAFEAAVPVPGKINDEAFEWLGDADARMGPVLEVVINGQYKWLPVHQVTGIEMGEPSELLDLIWAQANFTWVNGGNAVGFIPVRYPGTEKSADGDMLLARKTDWKTLDGGIQFGLGQREFATDVRDYAMLEVRTVAFENASAETSAPS